jgi:hypothetical protein
MTGREKFSQAVEKWIDSHPSILLEEGAGKNTTVEFSVSADGVMQGLRVQESSGSCAHDSRVIEAMHACGSRAKLLLDEAPNWKFSVVVNCNLRTWGSVPAWASADLQPTFDDLLGQLARQWRPPHLNSSCTEELQFNIDSSGTIVNFEIVPRPYDVLPHNPIAARAFHQSIDKAAQSWLNKTPFPRNRLESIGVCFVYQPTPRRIEIKSGLIGTCCSCFDPPAQGEISFFDSVPITCKPKHAISIRSNQAATSNHLQDRCPPQHLD